MLKCYYYIRHRLNFRIHLAIILRIFFALCPPFYQIKIIVFFKTSIVSVVIRVRLLFSVPVSAFKVNDQQIIELSGTSRDIKRRGKG